MVTSGGLVFSGVPVTEVIGERVAATIQLSAAALLIAIVVGLSLGIIAAVRHNSAIDRLATGIALLGVSFPPSGWASC